MKNRVIIIMCIIALNFIVVSCATSGPNVIFKPETLYRSPALDFSKIQAVAIMPVNNYDNEVPEVSGAINDALPIELKASQKAWNVISHDEILRKVNEKGWGRGYQNYVADLNTYVQVAGGTPNFTSETYKFFDDMSKELNFQAIVFTSYSYIEEIQPGEKLFYGAIDLSTKTKILSITTILFDLSSRRAWWLARISVKGGEKVLIPELVRSAIQGIAQNFGRGILRQL
ncbi:MAG: hypothetical protein QHH13_10460 [Melioribacter sp.]|uniref:hypothetical protein n=1 Tax=Rosettibacter primus TaxID=3111523 RepID=UPI00247DE57E|nr:hypothetical protein [Melioribacter sp.]